MNAKRRLRTIKKFHTKSRLRAYFAGFDKEQCLYANQQKKLFVRVKPTHLMKSSLVTFLSVESGSAGRVFSFSQMCLRA